MTKRVFAGLLGVLLAAGCATSGGPDGPAAPSGAAPSAADAECGESDCFFARNMRDFRVLDNRTLVVWASSRRCPYVVELARPCGGIRFANTIAFDSRDSYVCSYGGDAVLTRQGGGPDRCAIVNVRRISAQQLEGLYVEYGLTDPVPTPPAEIELEDEGEASRDSGGEGTAE